MKNGHRIILTFIGCVGMSIHHSQAALKGQSSDQGRTAASSTQVDIELREQAQRFERWRAKALTGSGPHPARREENTSLPTHTIYRPANLGSITGRLPIIAFGNGGCRNTSIEYTAFLAEIASRGYIILAAGRNDVDFAIADLNESSLSANGLPVQVLSASILTKGVDWMISESSRVGSLYYKKVDPTKIAYMGQSCGGIQALTASVDLRTTTTLVLNSGYFDASTWPGYKENSELPTIPWTHFHAPIAYFVGGPEDVAYKAAEANFRSIRTLPVMKANLAVGHVGAYPQPDMRWTLAILGWLDWQLKGDAKGRAMFVPPRPTLGEDKDWEIESKNLPK
jgi:hypothetical protein